MVSGVGVVVVSEVVDDGAGGTIWAALAVGDDVVSLVVVVVVVDDGVGVVDGVVGARGRRRGLLQPARPEPTAADESSARCG